jgi:hypothetical protein
MTTTATVTPAPANFFATLDRRRASANPGAPGAAAPPPPPEPCLAVQLLHDWEDAVTAGNREAADFAIARLKDLAQRPYRNDD